MRLRYIAIGILPALGAPSSAFAQCTGNPPSGRLCANGAAAAGLPSWYTQSVVLDRNFGNPSAQGTILNRGVSTWNATSSLSLGLNGAAGGLITLNGTTSGSVTIGVPAAAGTGTIFNFPATTGTAGFTLHTDGSGNASWSTSGSGTVTSIGMTVATTVLAVAPATITSSGTFAISLVAQTGNLVFAGPSTTTTLAPTFRALVGADLPNPAASTLGGVLSTAAVSHQWLNSLSTTGSFGLSQPAFADISGSLSSTQCPTPTLVAIGCVEGYVAVTHQWINAISTAGVPSSTQPNYTDLAGAAGIDANILNAQSGNYTAVVGDAGKVIYVTGGPFTVTLPPVAGFASNAVLSVCNGNQNNSTSHAVLLSGFPNPFFPRLYMQQCGKVAIENGVWAAKSFPGRFHPAFTPTWFVDNGGSDNNDGFISNAGGNALQTMGGCFRMAQVEYDLSGNVQPICSPTGGQTLVGSWSIIGPLVGASVINVSGNGGTAILQPTLTSGFVLQLSDFAPYVISTNATWDCTGGSAGCVSISLHQQTGVDLDAGTSLKGNGGGHTGISCDSFCKVNVAASPLFVSGTMAYAASMDGNSVMNVTLGLTVATSATLSGGIFNIVHNSVLSFAGLLSANTSAVVNEVFTLRTGAQGCLSSNFTSTGVISGRQWSILNNAVFGNVSSNSVPGVASGINSASGFAPGILINNGTSAGSC